MQPQYNLEIIAILIFDAVSIRYLKNNPHFLGCVKKAAFLLLYSL